MVGEKAVEMVQYNHVQIQAQRTIYTGSRNGGRISGGNQTCAAVENIPVPVQQLHWSGQDQDGVSVRAQTVREPEREENPDLRYAQRVAENGSHKCCSSTQRVGHCL